MTYIVIYTHRHGTNTGLVECDHLPTRREIIKALPHWDFELERDDEFLEWEAAPTPVQIP